VTFEHRYDLPLSIATLMVQDFATGCRAFYQTFWGSLEKYMFEDMQEWMGLFHALAKLIHVNPLPQVLPFPFSYTSSHVCALDSFERVRRPFFARALFARDICASP
jgi:hypothetical protein